MPEQQAGDGCCECAHVDRSGAGLLTEGRLLHLSHTHASPSGTRITVHVGMRAQHTTRNEKHAGGGGAACCGPPMLARVWYAVSLQMIHYGSGPPRRRVATDWNARRLGVYEVYDGALGKRLLNTRWTYMVLNTRWTCMVLNSMHARSGHDRKHASCALN